jgi:hypothetical protein
MVLGDTLKFLAIFKTAYNYFTKNFVMLLSIIVIVSKYESFYLCCPSGIENSFLSVPSYIKVHFDCLSNFPTALPLSGWVKASSEV